jgi:hypothetical protein
MSLADQGLFGVALIVGAVMSGCRPLIKGFSALR